MQTDLESSQRSKEYEANLRAGVGGWVAGGGGGGGHI